MKLQTTIMGAVFMLLAAVACKNSAPTNAEAAVTDTTKEQPASPAAIAQGVVGADTVTITYSQPAVKGRTIWGDLVPYGEVWRTGANEATTFETSQAILVNGKKLNAGKYALFTIPTEKEWTFIFNTAYDQWGAYDYEEDKDALRVTATPVATDSLAERLTFAVADNNVTLSWEKLSVGFAVAPAK